MNSKLKINGVPIENIYEIFTTSEQSTYGVADSKISDGSNRFRVNGVNIKGAYSETFPTSAGAYIGGANTSQTIKSVGANVDIALKGCRPIGIPQIDLSPGTYYINRVGGLTWVSSSPNSATGTNLSKNPKYIHIEMQGGGGSGAASSSFHASSGGGGGGYCYTAQQIPENSYLRLVVGAGAIGPASKQGDGGTGGDTTLYNASGGVICVANGGGYGRDNSGTAPGGSASGGIVNAPGGYGGNKEQAGGGTSALNVSLSKPETTIWARGNYSGGSSSGNNYGGGGGASAFADGAIQNTRSAGRNGILGAGGSGGSYQVGGHSGGDGGPGLARIYY